MTACWSRWIELETFGRNATLTPTPFWLVGPLAWPRRPLVIAMHREIALVLLSREDDLPKTG